MFHFVVLYLNSKTIQKRRYNQQVNCTGPVEMFFEKPTFL